MGPPTPPSRWSRPLVDGRPAGAPPDAEATDLDELLAGLGIMQLTEALDDPRLAATIRRMGLDVVRAAVDRLEARNAREERARTAPGRDQER